MATLTSDLQHLRQKHQTWGLPPGNFLWIHSDEKWFHALVPRSNAKACEELGLLVLRESYSAHHKSHIGKVMAHCTVGYYFDTDVEQGGQGFLLGLHRCANFKVPLRDVRFSTKDPVTQRTSFAGNPINQAPKRSAVLGRLQRNWIKPGYQYSAVLPVTSIMGTFTYASCTKIGGAWWTVRGRPGDISRGQCRSSHGDWLHPVDGRKVPWTRLAIRTPGTAR